MSASGPDRWSWLARFWRWVLGRDAKDLALESSDSAQPGESVDEPAKNLAPEAAVEAPSGVLAAGPSRLNAAPGADAMASADELPVAPLPALLFAGGDQASLYGNCTYLAAPGEIQEVLVLLGEVEAARWFSNAHGLFELERERRAAAAAPVQRARTIAHIREALRERHLAPSGWDVGPAGLPGPGNGFGDVTAVRPPRRRRPRRGGA